MMHKPLLAKTAGALTLASAMLFLGLTAGCDRSTDPIEDYRFIGITETDQTGAVVGTRDNDDWCPATINQGTIPNEYYLNPAFPNATSNTCTVPFGIPAADSVKIVIIAWPDVVIRELTNGPRSAGNFGITWDLRNDDGARVDPGIYRCRMTASGFSCQGDIQVQ
ncbi:hypothetical protein GF420_16290 [candidate division GN15 bacterium]|nr:hypothetical protein [candidate division GN15 bacterium]